MLLLLYLKRQSEHSGLRPDASSLVELCIPLQGQTVILLFVNGFRISPKLDLSRNTQRCFFFQCFLLFWIPRKNKKLIHCNFQNCLISLCNPRTKN